MGTPALNDDEPDSLGEFIGYIGEFAEAEVPHYADSIHPDAEGLARLLWDLKNAQFHLAAAAEYVEDLLADAMPTKTLEVSGIGQIERHTGAKRTKWAHDDLATHVARSISTELDVKIVDGQTSEIMDTYAMIKGIIDKFRTASSDGWKMRGLRAMMINPDEFCETTWGRKTVEFPPIEKVSS